MDFGVRAKKDRANPAEFYVIHLFETDLYYSLKKRDRGELAGEREEKKFPERRVTKKVPTASVLGSYLNIYHSSRPAASTLTDLSIKSLSTMHPLS